MKDVETPVPHTAGLCALGCVHFRLHEKVRTGRCGKVANLSRSGANLLIRRSPRWIEISISYLCTMHWFLCRRTIDPVTPESRPKTESWKAFSPGTRHSLQNHQSKIVSTRTGQGQLVNLWGSILDGDDFRLNWPCSQVSQWKFGQLNWVIQGRKCPHHERKLVRKGRLD